MTTQYARIVTVKFLIRKHLFVLFEDCSTLADRILPVLFLHNSRKQKWKRPTMPRWAHDFWPE